MNGMHDLGLQILYGPSKEDWSEDCERAYILVIPK